jgi:hypothetical protein
MVRQIQTSQPESEDELLGEGIEESAATLRAIRQAPIESGRSGQRS